MSVNNDERKVIEFYNSESERMKSLYSNRSIQGKRGIIPWGSPDHDDIQVIWNRPLTGLQQNSPVLINIHGGAFAEGSAVTMDSFCQKVADSLKILVVNLDYKLFPEVTYPYPVEETSVVHEYLIKKADLLSIDPDRIAVCGFSAGATIAFGSELELLQRGDKGYRCIVGGYPMTSGRSEDEEQCPYEATNDLLSMAMKMSMNGMENDPICSCLLANDAILKKIEEVIICTCGKDSLHSMGNDFAKRLVHNGVPLLYRDYKNALHGFIEVNEPSYFLPDERKNDEQLGYALDAEDFIIKGLSIML